LDWTVIGVNYQKANLQQRQKYALSEDQILLAYSLFKKSNIQNALILSTCNRTEFFLPIEAKDKAVEILTNKVYQIKVEADLFHCKSEEEAVEYFFRISSGLESQITGDFEILGQVRKACTLAKKNGMVSGTWERIINNALAAAKKARTQTGFYSGASSTSYACVEYLKSTKTDLKILKYLILGVGKIGIHTVDHLLKFADTGNITIANRTADKANELAKRKNINTIAFENFSDELEAYDVIICATNAPDYIITPSMFKEHKPHFIFDLSVPMNVDPRINNFKDISLVNVDELSVIINNNMKLRDAERQSVERIIDEGIQDLEAWFTIKSGMPLLSELKDELEQLKIEALSNVDTQDKTHSKEFLNEYTDELFNQISQQWIKKVRNKTLNAH